MKNTIEYVLRNFSLAKCQENASYGRPSIDVKLRGSAIITKSWAAIDEALNMFKFFHRYIFHIFMNNYDNFPMFSFPRYSIRHRKKTLEDVAWLLCTQTSREKKICSIREWCFSDIKYKMEIFWLSRFFKTNYRLSKVINTFFIVFFCFLPIFIFSVFSELRQIIYCQLNLSHRMDDNRQSGSSTPYSDNSSIQSAHILEKTGLFFLTGFTTIDILQL